METEKVALIAVIGASPAVLTETVWGLHAEKPELVPDEVKIFTTQYGWDTFNKNVLTAENGSSVWEDLQTKVGKEIILRKHIFEDKKGGVLKDIVTCEDQELVADQLLKGIREYKNPMQETYRLVGSVAGGRKSMSALMYAAMSLGADADDIITHVLADDKVLAFNDFYFPGQTKQQLEPRGGDKSLTMTAADVKIDLAEIPFVPLATLVKNSDFSTAGTFTKLVQRARQTVEKVGIKKTKIRVHKSKCIVRINNREIEGLTPHEYALLAIMAEHAMNNKDDSTKQISCDQVYAIRDKMRENKQFPSSICETKNMYFITQKTDNTASDCLASVKFDLKKRLKDQGFEAVIKDAFSHGKVGFRKITDIDFTSK